MKRFFLSLATTLLFAASINAARAYPGHKTIRQPDGTQLTIMGHGDEYRHWVTTTDGYSIVKGADGIYRYAVTSGDDVRASEIKCHNEAERSQIERSFLLTIPKNIAKPVSQTGVRLQKLSRRTDSFLSPRTGNVGKGRKVSDKAAEASKKYRGLVILVNFRDCKFSRGTSAHTLVDEMMNGKDRTHYDDPLINGQIACTGSVRDYFDDNSNGLFVPEFDVIGPVEIEKSQYFINGTENTYSLCREVLECADGQIDFSRYDCDGDDEVDMVYILYAGNSSTYQGNDERLVWPHAGHFADNGEELILDGKRVGRFACSSELYGWTDDRVKYLDGIGVIVHEFSHVLGFKDHYDVSGYLNEDPGSWDVMASGNYNGVLNDTPCGYSAYERHAAGFIRPRTLTVKDDGHAFDLNALSSSGEAFRIVSMQDSTVFMLENRQPEKWDLMLPGHGMLVWCVDSCDTHYWDRNALNVENRLHLRLVRANGADFNIFHEMDDTDSDPFPGRLNVTELSNYTSKSNLLSDLKYPSPLELHGIEEIEGVISFNIGVDRDADRKPYTFQLADSYTARGVLIGEMEDEMEWTVSVTKAGEGSGDRSRIFNLVPDTDGVASADPKYADGFNAPYLLGTDKRSITIEPSRVALIDNMGVWLVDFTDLDRGGSGAIRLDMDPYGNLSLADPESIIGYCTMPRTSVVVDQISIIERLSMFRNLTFQAATNSAITVIGEALGDERIYNLQGIPVDHPKPGSVYIVGGKKKILKQAN